MMYPCHLRHRHSKTVVQELAVSYFATGYLNASMGDDRDLSRQTLAVFTMVHPSDDRDRLILGFVCLL